MTSEKGVLELARAIPLILSRRNNIRFLIVGDGPLLDEMKKELEAAACLDKVHFAGGVMPDKVPGYLNQMKFHILPSYTEAFPSANLQAMACGTISIATSVGALPDTIVDGETGFLLKDNLPQTIADKVVEVWDHPGLDRIQKRARAFVEQNFTYERAVESWRLILSSL